MKKNISILSLVAVLFFAFSACKNDFNIAAQWKEIPVVYGLLNADSSVQYIRIEKGFLDQHLGALQMAANPDSIYFADSKTFVVKIAGYDIYNNNKDNKFFQLVDGDTIGLPKQSGVFGSHPNLFFRLKSKLNSAYTYKLSVTRANGSTLVSSSTNLVGTANLYSPGKTISFLKQHIYDTKIGVGFNAGVNAVYTDVNIKFKYLEVNPATMDSSHKSFEIPLFNNVSINNTTWVPMSSLYFDGGAYFQTIASQLQPTSSLQRTFEGIEFSLFSVNQNLTNYVAVQQAQSGITSGTAQLEYSNVTGGLGIFASRTSKVFSNYTLTAESLDTLKKGRYTFNLGFDH